MQNTQQHNSISNKIKDNFDFDQIIRNNIPYMGLWLIRYVFFVKKVIFVQKYAINPFKSPT